MDFKHIKDVFEEKGYKVSCFKTAVDAKDYINSAIDKKTVGIGGSVTVEQLGLYESLSLHNDVFWHARQYQDKTPEQVRSFANSAQIYISSVNALSESGEIINIDGACNRVSSICYGHEKVYFVIGKNKIAKDFDSALYRARNIAAPQNARRLNKNTPCAKNADRCYDCKSPERICRVLSVWWSKPTIGEYEIILINENLGY